MTLNIPRQLSRLALFIILLRATLLVILCENSSVVVRDHTTYNSVISCDPTSGGLLPSSLYTR